MRPLSAVVVMNSDDQLFLLRDMSKGHSLIALKQNSGPKPNSLIEIQTKGPPHLLLARNLTRSTRSRWWGLAFAFIFFSMVGRRNAEEGAIRLSSLGTRSVVSFSISWLLFFSPIVFNWEASNSNHHVYAVFVSGDCVWN